MEHGHLLNVLDILGTTLKAAKTHVNGTPIHDGLDSEAHCKPACVNDTVTQDLLQVMHKIKDMDLPLHSRKEVTSTQRPVLSAAAHSHNHVGSAALAPDHQRGVLLSPPCGFAMAAPCLDLCKSRAEDPNLGIIHAGSYEVAIKPQPYWVRESMKWVFAALTFSSSTLSALTKRTCSIALPMQLTTKAADVSRRACAIGSACHPLWSACSSLGILAVPQNQAGSSCSRRDPMPIPFPVIDSVLQDGGLPWGACQTSRPLILLFCLPRQ